VKRRVNSPSQKEAKRQHILAVAANQFSTYGFDVANINTIADLAGVGKGTMYRYAKDKEDLFLQVLEEAAKRIQSCLDQALVDSEGLPMQERFRMLIARLTTLELTYPDYIALHNSTVYGIVHRRFRGITLEFLHRLMFQFEELFTREVAAGKIRAVNPHRMAMWFIGQLHTFGRITNLLGEPAADPGGFLAEVLWQGLKP
jgi:AcrR family transcriptional regulator